MHDRAHKEGCVYPQPLVFTLLGHKRDFPSHLAIKDNARLVKFCRKRSPKCVKLGFHQNLIILWKEAFEVQFDCVISLTNGSW